MYSFSFCPSIRLSVLHLYKTHKFPVVIILYNKPNKNILLNMKSPFLETIKTHFITKKKPNHNEIVVCAFCVPDPYGNYKQMEKFFNVFMFINKYLTT